MDRSRLEHRLESDKHGRDGGGNVGVERSEQRLGLIRKILDGSIWWMISQISTLLLRSDMALFAFSKLAQLFWTSSLHSSVSQRCHAFAVSDALRKRGPEARSTTLPLPALLDGLFPVMLLLSLPSTLRCDHRSSCPSGLHASGLELLLILFLHVRQRIQQCPQNP